MALEGSHLEPDEVEPLVAKYMGLCPETFGGVMLWEATASDRNQINGVGYADSIKKILNKCGPTPSPSTLTSPSNTAPLLVLLRLPARNFHRRLHQLWHRQRRLVNRVRQLPVHLLPLGRSVNRALFLPANQSHLVH